MSDLANKITAFLDKHAMELTRFGQLATGDSHIAHDIMRGERKLRRATVRKIEDFMRAYKPGKRK
jgi:hypothetical protein